MKLDIVNYGMSIACRFGQSFSLGAGLSYYDFSLDSKTERFLPPLFEAPDFDDANVTDIQSQLGEDDDWGFTGGLLWQIPGGKWSLAAVYRQGPDFDFAATSQPGPDSFGLLNRRLLSEQSAKFHVPDVYGFGISWKLTRPIRISLDYNRIEYSHLTRDFVDIFNVEEIFGFDPRVGRVQNQ